MFQTFGCNAQNENVKKFGANADYYLALKLLEKNDGNNIKEAQTKLNRCIKKGDKIFSKKSAQKLSQIGTIQEQIKNAVKLVQLFPDDKESLLIAARVFYRYEENSLIYEFTDNLDLQNDDNELIRIRLTALEKLNVNSYESEVFDWFTKRSISKEHYQFYRDIYNHPDFENVSLNKDEQNLQKNEKTDNSLEFNGFLEFQDKVEQELSDFQNQKELINPFVMNFRIELYKRNYTYAFSHVQTVINLLKNGDLQPCEQLASDLGKACLYGSANYLQNAQDFIVLAEYFSNTPMEFYFWFYAGRCFEKIGTYFSESKKCFENAMEKADSDKKKDNALWYLLDTMLDYQLDFLITNIHDYAKLFHDAEYFDDFFDKLSVTLISSARWKGFQSVYKKIDGYATDETVAKYAYIFARLAQEKITIANEQQINEAFLRAIQSGSALYYKILSAYQLNFDEKQLQEVLFCPVMSKEQRNKKISDMTKLDEQMADLLMEGYVSFGFPDLIYEEWKTYFPDLSEETNFFIAEFLHNCGKTDYTNSFYTQSLRIASKNYNYSTETLTQTDMKLVFPQCYNDEIEKYATEYMISPNIMYALVRSESFFDPNIKSAVGAVGLTQLMEFTASDVARKLKLTDYSLVDVETNLHIGTYYLAELLHRCDNSLLQAFFSYNAGITRVRRWLKSSLTEFGTKSKLPMDLFLETLPYTETREYGRKLVSAATMYDFLENPQNFSQTVKQLLK